MLANHLRDVVTTHPALPADAARRSTLPFWEAYFSNFIEGTEFTPDEAERIVFEGEVPAARTEDAHDVLGTYQLVADETEMRRRTGSADEFIELLRDWYRLILGGRPDKRFAGSAGRTGRICSSPTWIACVVDRGLQLLDPEADQPAVATGEPG